MQIVLNVESGILDLHARYSPGKMNDKLWSKLGVVDFTEVFVLPHLKQFCDSQSLPLKYTTNKSVPLKYAAKNLKITHNSVEDLQFETWLLTHLISCYRPPTNPHSISIFQNTHHRKITSKFEERHWKKSLKIFRRSAWNYIAFDSINSSIIVI